MVELSTTNEIDQDCAICETGHLFLTDIPDSISKDLNIRGFVNSKKTPFLNSGETYLLKNSPEKTINSLELEVSGQRRTICKSLTDFEIDNPKNLRVFLGAVEGLPKPYVPKGRLMEYAIQNTSKPQEIDGMYMLALEGAGGAVPVGQYNLDSSPQMILAQIADGISAGFGINWDDISTFYRGFGGKFLVRAIKDVIKFETTYQNIMPQKLRGVKFSVADKIKFRIAFLKDIFSSKNFYVKDINGKTSVVFRGMQSLRGYMLASYYPANSIKVIDSKATSSGYSAGAAVKGIFRGGVNRVFWVIGGLITIGDWIKNPSNEKTLSDLFVDLGLMVLTAIASVAIATLIVTAIVGLTALTAGGVVAGILVGIFALFISAGINWLLDVTGAKALLQKAGRFLTQYVGDFLIEGLENLGAARMKDPLFVEMATRTPSNAVAQAMGLPQANPNITYDNDTMQAIYDYLAKHN